MSRSTGDLAVVATARPKRPPCADASAIGTPWKTLRAWRVVGGKDKRRMKEEP